ncbi:Por secretion system C-terminal sorting domain-containing protein [Dyadobacter sp. SG02]|uniref:SdrD B-like domain-containing protein n=1 Tax=Dyadobacter sp. SG02 TaxID=1855291 RepID=UPI0008C05E86|nr:SdrD B-like domain-containing protein [Dyadobacter sp. SG02]SEJ74372.1 Por secretion system C-terminal sorting domain-containing protein [Dyadobacter sp. SG02]
MLVFLHGGESELNLNFTLTMRIVNFTEKVIALTLLVTSSISYAQTPALTGTVTGVVWKDSKPSDGLRAPSETKVAGILVKLLTVDTGEVVSTALSNENGEYSLNANAGTYMIEYVYPTDGFTAASQRVGADNTINSAADADNLTAPFSVADNQTISEYGLGLVAKENTITYCTQKESVTTEWSQNLMLPKSTVTPVPLNVKIFAAEAVYHPVIGVENTATAAGYSITAAGKVTMTIPINPASLVMNSDVTVGGTLGDYDGDQDYNGTSGISFFNRYSFANTSPARSTNNAAIIATNFVGSGNDVFTIPTLAQSSVAITGSGNLETFVRTYVSAGACVVYTYEEGALPVTLVSFNAQKRENAGALEWKTSSETNSDRFEIERSSQGKNWEKIGTVQAAKESSALFSYSFLDTAPLHGQNLYRLKMIDSDETFAYSHILNLDFKNNARLVVYPNPASEKIQVKSDSEKEVSKIEIYNRSGVLTAQSIGNNFVDVLKLSTGTYSVKVYYKAGFSESQNIMIVK